MSYLEFIFNHSLNLATGIIIGMVTGIYSGLIVARAARFYDIKAKALRLVRCIDWIIDDSGLTIERPMRYGDLSLLASDMFHLRHNKAGELLLNLDTEISTVQHEGMQHGRHAREFNEMYGRWQRIIREVQPDWSSILFTGRL